MHLEAGSACLSCKPQRLMFGAVPAVLQVAIYLFACLLQIPNAVLILLMVFTLGSPITSRSWSCTADATADAACAAVFSNPTTAGFCALNPSQWTWSDPNHAFVSKFNMICADSWKSQLANSFFFVGYLIGSGVFGTVADAYGRKGMTFGATVLAAVFTAAALGVTNYWVLMVLRLLTGESLFYSSDVQHCMSERVARMYRWLACGAGLQQASLCGTG
jgi:hypothetical protein